MTDYVLTKRMESGCVNGDYDQVLEAIEKGEDVNRIHTDYYPRYGNGFLHYVPLNILLFNVQFHKKGQTYKIAKLLIDNGADPKIQPNTLLKLMMQFAAIATFREGGRFEEKIKLMTLLLDHGIGPKNSQELADICKQCGGNPSVVEIILERGGKEFLNNDVLGAAIECLWSFSVAKLLIEKYRLSLKEVPKDSIRVAFEGGCLEKTQFLLDHGFQPKDFY